MSVLENIEPKSVFEFFEEITKIPHGSGNTSKISDYLVGFAKKRGLEHYQDELGNVVIIKEATKGYEKSVPVIIQGHMDMVCAKDETCKKDMQKEGLDICIEGDLIKAKGTTLGGDDGIAVAFALAILDSDNLSHPRVEAVFTIDEEIGLIGANGLDTSILKGKYLINIDSENEGIITVGCAGGNRTSCIFDVKREKYDGEIYAIKVSGLRGGHSGVEIGLGGQNASKIMGDVLKSIAESVDFRIVYVVGGPADNVITTSSLAVISTNDASKINDIVLKKEAEIKSRAKEIDKDLKISVESLKDFTVQRVHKQDKIDITDFMPIDKNDTKKIVEFLSRTKQGIVKMSEDIEGLVQTSLNLGIIDCSENQISFSFSVRSSVNAEKEELTKEVCNLSESLGGSSDVSGSYPGWEYKKESHLRDIATKVYKEQYKEVPVVETIHAGLECGLICDKIKGLDAISIGPDMFDIHTPKERLSISSTKRVYEFVLEMLRQLK